MDKIASKLISKPVIIGAVSVLAVSAGLAGYVWYENHRPPVLEVYVIPLKTGQALFIRTPNDKRILVDGGTNSEIIRYISKILPFYSRRIDQIIVTRTDGAHVTGLIDAVNRYAVGEVVAPGITLESLGLASSTDQIHQTFLDAAASHKIP